MTNQESSAFQCMQVKDYTQLKKVIRELRNHYQRTPSLKEVAEAMGKPEEYVKDLMEKTQEVQSLDVAVGGGDFKYTLGDTIKSSSDTEETVITSLSAHDLDKILSDTVSEREKMIIQRLYGFDGNKGQSLEKVGSQIGVTRERIRQIRDKAFQKIKRAGARGELDGLIPEQWRHFPDIQKNRMPQRSPKNKKRESKSGTLRQID